jgi:hypothetical protein
MRNAETEGGRVKRRLLNMMVGVSLVLCVATAALWVRGRSVCDEITCTTKSHRSCCLMTYPNELVLVIDASMAILLQTKPELFEKFR